MFLCVCVRARICACLSVMFVNCAELYRYGDVLGAGAGLKDMEHNSPHKLSSLSHTPFQTHWKSGAQITENTVTPAICRAKPKFGPKYPHDLKAGIIITLLLWR